MKFFSKSYAAGLIAIFFYVFVGLFSVTVKAQTSPTPPYSTPSLLSEPIIFEPGIISTGNDESHPTFTPDGHTLYFLKNTPDLGHSTIVISHFRNGQWSTPQVAPFSGRYNDADVAFSGDGNTLFFVSNRPVNGQHHTDTDLWVIQKTAAGWGSPHHLSTLSSPGFEWFPSLTDDGILYFGSERRPGNFGPKGTSDIWMSRKVDGQWSKPQNLGDVINTPGNDIEGFIAPDGRFLIFASNGRPDSRGAYDLYISYRQNGHWTEPQNLGDAINTPAWEFGARLSPDGRYLFYTSDQSVLYEPFDHRLNYKELLKKLNSPGNGLRDIYQVGVSILPPPPQ